MFCNFMAMRVRTKNGRLPKMNFMGGVSTGYPVDTAWVVNIKVAETLSWTRKIDTRVLSSCLVLGPLVSTRLSICGVHKRFLANLIIHRIILS